jgi:hypothetical protein
MKLLDPMAGYRVALLTPYVLLSLMISYFFMFCFTYKEDEAFKVEIKHNEEFILNYRALAAKLYWSTTVSFLLTSFTEFYLAPTGHLVFKTLFEVCAYGLIFLIYVDARWSMAMNDKICNEDPSLDCKNNPNLVHREWCQVWFAVVSLFLFASAYTTAIYKLRQNCGRGKPIKDLQK